MIAIKAFGRTKHLSSRILFGAFALSNATPKEADEMLEMIIRFGINHIDTAPSYGHSELSIGPWMKTHRDQFFLATKTEGRTYKTAMDELYQSLERLQVEAVDLWQMHNIINQEQWETAMKPGGAIDALLEAKKRGLTKYIGITGHGLAAPRRHLQSLERYDFDTVLLPYNFSLMQNEQYAADFDQLEKVCLERNVAIQTIKAIAKGIRPEHQSAQHNTWYAPIDDDEGIQLAVNWVLGNENVFLNTAGDKTLLEKTLKVASQFTVQPDDATMLKSMSNNGITPLFSGDEF
ncbi:MAG: aldo/keto reductase [Prolixibacteraceae bacterium]|nr:aldo/keto reductase [Prolixibacteraceae bacterium]